VRGVQPELIIRRRRIGSEDLDRIRQLIREEGHLGRSHISNRLCTIWDWRQANGRFRQIACRDLLRRLHSRELIELPTMLHPARRPGYRNTVRAPEAPDSTEVEGPLAAWRAGLELTLVRSRSQTQLFNGLIDAHHYLGYQQPTGAQLKYLAYHADRPIACLSFGPAAFKIAPRDQFLGWSARQREERLPWLVNNDRFLILPWIRIPNLAAWLLSHCLRRLRRDWQEVYRHDLALCETFIEQDRFQGACYAAANWVPVGQTQGRGRNDRFKQYGQPIKTIWLSPLRPDFRPLLTSS
jgi:hypothetical protein